MDTNCDGRLPICCETAFTSYVRLMAAYTTASYIFFTGRHAVVISHGLIKEAAVPAVDIERAIVRRMKFEANPRAHTMKTEL